jgi:hypothetical protein
MFCDERAPAARAVKLLPLEFRVFQKWGKMIVFAGGGLFVFLVWGNDLLAAADAPFKTVPDCRAVFPYARKSA